MPTEGIQLGFPNRFGDDLLADLVKEVVAIYTPEVETWCESMRTQRGLCTVKSLVEDSMREVD